MPQSRDILRFLIIILAPFVFIFGGAGLAALGLTTGWSWLLWFGLIVAGIGLLWTAVLIMLSGPLEWLS